MSDRYLLPSNATPEEAAIAGAVSRISDVPTPARDLYNPAQCPAHLLPWLAWAFSVDEWNPLWSDAQKREAIASSVFVHKHKGTVGAVRGALAALGFGAQLQEWFNQTPAGDPYTYRLLLEADQVGIDEAALEAIKYVVASTKNLRSHLDTIVPGVKTLAGPTIGGVASSGNEITVSFGGNVNVYDGSTAYNGQYRHNGLKFNG